MMTQQKHLIIFFNIIVKKKLTENLLDDESNLIKADDPKAIYCEILKIIQVL